MSSKLVGRRPKSEAAGLSSSRSGETPNGCLAKIKGPRSVKERNPD